MPPLQKLGVRPLEMIDLPTLLRRLAFERPVFHSEADFQHALAWTIHVHHPTASVRLEVPIECRGKVIHLDLLVSIDGEKSAIELKYKPRALDCVVGGEQFRLKHQGANDHGRYDFLKDIERIETLTASGLVSSGTAVVLTNDPLYWSRGREQANDRALHLHEGRELGGTLSWAPTAGAGTIRKREAPIELKRLYKCAWCEYSDVPNAPDSPFRVLVLQIEPFAV